MYKKQVLHWCLVVKVDFPHHFHSIHYDYYFEHQFNKFLLTNSKLEWFKLKFWTSLSPFFRLLTLLFDSDDGNHDEGEDWSRKILVIYIYALWLAVRTFWTESDTPNLASLQNTHILCSNPLFMYYVRYIERRNILLHDHDDSAVENAHGSTFTPIH